MDTNHTGRPLHPISVVAERTGLSPDLLRVWERRYGIVEPARDEGGRRLYTDADIERLRLLSQATSGGRSIGQLLDLDTAALAELVRSDETARWKAPHPGAPGTGATGDEGAAAESVVERALGRVRALDGPGLDIELSRAAATLGAAVFLESVVAPLFRRVGDAWHAGELSIAHEHLATGVVHPLLARLRRSLPVAATAPMVVVATPAGERHEVGAQLAAGAAALEGWRVMYLGSDLPAQDIARAALDVGARVVALSTVTAPDREALGRELRSLRDALPADVEIVIGGAGATRLNGAASLPGISIVTDLSELRRRLSSG